ncbi:MAG: hypothetical protein R3Y63_11260 [Eubacteriales bacterium]
MEDMSLNVTAISEKLELEATKSNVAYDLGEHFLQAFEKEGVSYVTLFDHNFQTETQEIYGELQNNELPPLTQAIHEFCEKYNFEGVESVLNRSAPMIDPVLLEYNFMQARETTQACNLIEDDFGDETTPSFAIFRLKDNEINNQISQIDLASLNLLGEIPDKGDYNCIFSDSLEDLMIDYIEVMDERPDVFTAEFETALYENIEYNDEFVWKFNELLDSDVIGLQYEGDTTYFYNDVGGLEVIDFEQQPFKLTLRSDETPSPTMVDLNTLTSDKLMELMGDNENLENILREVAPLLHGADTTMELTNEKQKLQEELLSGSVAYKVGDFYVTATENTDSIDVILYDSNLYRQSGKSYDEVSTITEALNKFCENYEFEGIETLENRSADMLNSELFQEKFQESDLKHDQSVVKISEWYNNPEDSIAFYSLNATEFNEQLQGKDIEAHLEVGGLDRRNYSCVTVENLADTTDKQVLEAAISDLQNGNSEKLATLLHELQVENFETGIATGTVVGLKLDGVTSEYFLGETDVQSVDFDKLPSTFVDKVYEEPNFTLSDLTSEKLAELMTENVVFSSIVEESVAANLINSQLETELPMNEVVEIAYFCNDMWRGIDDTTLEKIQDFIVLAINQGEISPSDLEHLGKNDFLEAYFSDDTSKLAQAMGEITPEQDKQEVKLSVEKDSQLFVEMDSDTVYRDFDIIKTDVISYIEVDLLTNSTQDTFVVADRGEYSEKEVNDNEWVNPMAYSTLEEALSEYDNRIYYAMEMTGVFEEMEQQEKAQEQGESQISEDEVKNPSQSMEKESFLAATSLELSEMMENNDFSTKVSEAIDFKEINTLLDEKLSEPELRFMQELGENMLQEKGNDKGDTFQIVADLLNDPNTNYSIDDVKMLRLEDIAHAINYPQSGKDLEHFVLQAHRLENAVMDNSPEFHAEIQSYFEVPIPTADLEKFSELVTKTNIISSENTESMVFEYLIQEISELYIEMNDLHYLTPQDVDKAMNSYGGILVDREVQLENVVDKRKEMSMEHDIEKVQGFALVDREIVDNSEVFLGENTFGHFATFVRDVTEDDVGPWKHPHYYSGADYSTNSKNAEEDFNQRVEFRQPIEKMAQKQPDTEEISSLKEDKAAVVPYGDEENLFSATFTTQERVVIQSATDFAYDNLSEFSSEDKSLMADILDKIDINGDLSTFEPDDYVFVINEELQENGTIIVSGEELEIISEVCSKTDSYMEELPDSYRDILNTIIDKVENPEMDIQQGEPSRTVANTYTITDSEVVGDFEIAMGESEQGMFATWERCISADESKGFEANWNFGHYHMEDKESAIADFHQRIEDTKPVKDTELEKKVVKKDKEEKPPKESVLESLKKIKAETEQKEVPKLPTKEKSDQSL